MGDIHGVGGPARGVLTVRAAKTSVLLSLLFIFVYGSTNWFTAQRPAAQVKTWYFAWELVAIPYVPLLYVPYMSLDLLFFAAAFLCRDQRELRVFVQRLVFSILVAAAFFLLLPLRLAWPEPPRVAGWFGDFVEQSTNLPFLLEYPHNLFPSLHIALCMIVADVYARHTRGIVRVLLVAWFSLIVVSTLLTWQHHLVDILGGFVLTGFAFYLFRGETPRLPVARNDRVGAYYAAVTAGVLVVAVLVWPWGAFLLWPGVTFAITAAAYFGLGPGIFRKQDGRLPLAARFTLAPLLLGQWLSLLYYRGHSAAWNEVAPGVWFGRVLRDHEAKRAVAQGVSAVLDLTGEFSEAAPFLALNYKNLPILDLTAPTQDQLQEATAFIASRATQGVVYVHCKIGYSRSAAVVGAYLLASGRASSAEEASQILRAKRPGIVLRPEALEALQTFATGTLNAQRREKI